ncbi:MAG: hypothetical protein AB8B51_14135 [Sedimentitalea sp.]
MGRDPDELSAPGLAVDSDGRVICENIAPITRSKYDSVEGIHAAARNNKAVRKAVQTAEDLRNFLADDELARELAALDETVGNGQSPDMPPQKVVGGQFMSPLRHAVATTAVAQAEARPSQGSPQT